MFWNEVNIWCVSIVSSEYFYATELKWDTEFNCLQLDSDCISWKWNNTVDINPLIIWRCELIAVLFVLTNYIHVCKPYEGCHIHQLDGFHLCISPHICLPPRIIIVIWKSSCSSTWKWITLIKSFCSVQIRCNWKRIWSIIS